MTNKLPPCFAFRNSGKHPRKDEIKNRFNELDETDNWAIHNTNDYYGKRKDGVYTCYSNLHSFGSTVVEITEDDFLAMTKPEDNDLPNLQELIQTTMTEPELTKLPDNFYFQYVDEKDREVLAERFGKLTKTTLSFNSLDCYYGIVEKECVVQYNKDFFPNSTEITQQDFIRLTEPEKKVEPEIVTAPDFPYKGDIKDFPKEVGIWMMDCQEAQGNKRDISVFEKYRWQGRMNGGFDWNNAFDGYKFCENVISHKLFGAFYERYPNYTGTKTLIAEPLRITGQIIEISERGILIELTKEQIKEFKIFETVTIK